MRLTTKGRFAVTAMLDLALRGGKSPVTLAGISERQDISLSYLEQLFSRLRRHELVESVRGPGGGYYLARPLGDVSVADIIRAVDEPIDATQCGVKYIDRGWGMVEGIYQHIDKLPERELRPGVHLRILAGSQVMFTVVRFDPHATVETH